MTVRELVDTIFDGDRRETVFFTILAVVLVLVRCATYLIWGGVDFDSDQAIVGLMAKHLSELRTFPLFYYGLNYLLGVQAWIIAPFFLIARPSVALLKTPLVLLNVLAAVLMMRGISTRLRLRPAVGFVAALPFIVPTPFVAGSFLQTFGSSGVEPILYVIILWTLRRRPFAFGALLGLGFLHREFTMYAVPALALVELADGTRLTAATVKRMAAGALGFAAVWLIVDDVRMHLAGVSLVEQAQMLLGHDACFGASDYVARMRHVFAVALPILFGGRTMPLQQYATRSSAIVGSPAVGWMVGATLTFMVLRLAWLWRRARENAANVGFGAYLALVGGCAIAAYPLACSANERILVIIRYFNMGLLVPVGLCAVFMAREPSARLRSAVVVAFVLWGAANLTDNVKVIREAYVNPQPYPHRELTNFLISHGIKYARADYWDAYIVDFLSRERVVVGSYGPVRIPEYERLVDEHKDTAVNIVRTPCEGELRVSVWCIQAPAR